MGFNRGNLSAHLIWLQRGSSTREPDVCLSGSRCGNAGRSSSGVGPCGGNVHASSGHLWNVPHRGDDHAGRNLLWSSIRRVHHFDPGKHPRRVCLSGHLFGWISDGAAGQGGAGLGDRGLRFIHCRNHWSPGSLFLGPSPGGGCPHFWGAGVLCPHVPRADRTDLSGPWFHAQSFDYGCFRSLRRNGRHRHYNGNAAFHARKPGSHGGGRPGANRHGNVRDLRDPPEYRKDDEESAFSKPSSRGSSPIFKTGDEVLAPSCAEPGSASFWASFPAGEPSSPLLPPTRSRSAFPSIRKNLAPGSSKE